MQPTLFPEMKKREPDICRRKHGGAETSVEADKAVKKEADQKLILGYITAAKAFGMTLDELSIQLDRPPNRISGRLTELRMNGQIVISDLVRPTRTGCKSRVYVSV